MVPLILSLGSERRWVVSFNPGPLSQRKDRLEPTECEDGRALHHWWYPHKNVTWPAREVRSCHLKTV